MNKHFLILPLLLGTATALLLFSLNLPDSDMVVVVDPSTTPQPVDSSVMPSHQPSGSATSAVSSGKPSSSPSTKPSGKPSAKPTPSPTPTPLPSFGIAATTPDAVLREAQIQAGRVDPFKTILPPDLPEFEPFIEPEQMVLPSLPPLPVSDIDKPVTQAPTPRPISLETPSPRESLGEGLTLIGILDGGVDPIAMIDVRGRTEMVRVGERLNGNILVTSINYEERRVTLSRGSEKATLEIEEPKSLPY